MRVNRFIGRQVAGRFTIKSFLGEGGMATVFVAEQEAEPRQVALKIMNEDLTADRSFVKRFQREAKAAARVQHPNSVQLIDYGVADGLSYIAMELLAGEDLYALLERDGAINQGRAARIVVEVCDALMVAHELGIVHRDLKPENIMVIPDASAPSGERVKVLDFGIAKLLAPDTTAPVDPRLDPSSQVTRAGTFIGTPAYMAPEQCALLPVDTRADIYTCGVLLFQLCTGRLPFEGQTPLHTATLHIHEPAPRPSTFAPTIDPQLEAAIMKALAKKPTERHQTARHLASTLRKILVDLPDVRVAKVGKPAAGSIRARSTRSSAAPGPRPAAGTDAGMESARTMVANPSREGDPGSPPSVVLHGGSNGGGAGSDLAADSSPARIQAAQPARSFGGGGSASKSPGPAPKSPPRAPGSAGRSATPASTYDEDDPSSDDSMRTLVRAPAEEDAGPRFGPQHTEVIVPSASPAVVAAALATPQPAAGRPAPPPQPRAVPKPPPRIVNPTLKSAGEFKPSVQPRSVIDEPDSSVTPVINLAVAGSLGALELGASKLGSAPRAEPPGDAQPPADPKPAVPPLVRAPSVPIMVNAVAFAETAKVEVADPSQLGMRDGGHPQPAAAPPAVSGTAETVPLLSPSTLAAAMALATSTRPGATTLPVLIAPGAGPSPQAPRSPVTLTDQGLLEPPPPPTLQEPAPMMGAAEMAPLPQTPPVYPLAPTPEAGSNISGARGLIIGFLAGAVLMGLAALVYVLVMR